MKIVSLTRIWGTVAVLALMLTIPLLIPARVQAAPAQPSFLFGSVDLQKVVAGYKKKADLDAQVQALANKLQNQFNQQVGSDMLSKEDQQKLTALLSKPNPTDADKAQITALQQQSAKDAQELAALQQKQNPTAADQQRLQTLTQQHQAGQQALQDVADSYRQQTDAERERLSGQLTDTVRATVAQVAKDRGLMMVFDGQFTIYSANDITDDVLQRLNK